MVVVLTCIGCESEEERERKRDEAAKEKAKHERVALQRDAYEHSAVITSILQLIKAPRVLDKALDTGGVALNQDNTVLVRYDPQRLPSDAASVDWFWEDNFLDRLTRLAAHIETSDMTDQLAWFNKLTYVGFVDDRYVHGAVVENGAMSDSALIVGDAAFFEIASKKPLGSVLFDARGSALIEYTTTTTREQNRADESSDDLWTKVHDDVQQNAFVALRAAIGARAPRSHIPPVGNATKPTFARPTYVGMGVTASLPKGWIREATVGHTMIFRASNHELNPPLLLAVWGLGRARYYDAASCAQAGEVERTTFEGTELNAQLLSANVCTITLRQRDTMIWQTFVARGETGYRVRCDYSATDETSMKGCAAGLRGIDFAKTDH